MAVDIPKLPTFSKGNQYLLVGQEYFSEWPFARALPDQRTLPKVTLWPRSHLWEPPTSRTVQGFGVKKSHATPYHPMGDGLVERMNRSLLGLLCFHTQREIDWKEHLQLLTLHLQTCLNWTYPISGPVWTQPTFVIYPPYARNSLSRAMWVEQEPSHENYRATGVGWDQLSIVNWTTE